MKARKLALILLGAISLGIAAGGILVARHWPFSQAAVAESLQEDFPATVTFDKFRTTFFPHPGCVAEGIAFRRLGRAANTPPIVTIQRLTIEAHYADLFVRPHYLARIVLNGFKVNVPPRETSVGPSNWQASNSTTQVGEIIADGASIEIARSGDHPPLLFDIHTLKLTAVSQSQPMG